MGLNIKHAIKSRGLEVREVARRLDISPTGLSQHINGNPTVEVLNRIAEAIGCDIADLFDHPYSFTALFECNGTTYCAHSFEDARKIIEGLENKLA